MVIMKHARAIAILIVIILISAVLLEVTYFWPQTPRSSQGSEFYFGVSFGLNTTSEAKLLIDKVKPYTNLFLLDSWTIATNETALNEVCDYAVNNGLNIIVYFAFISHVIYPWQIDWVNNAKTNWGNKLLGIYYYDEPGGKQIDLGKWADDQSAAFANLTNYSEAANAFIKSINSSQSMRDLKANGFPAFTSDYALYWFDYLAGYDVVFAELGGARGTANKLQQISLCRGAANMQNKDWGAIITWTYNDPPYLENGTAMLDDVLTAYHAGAKYIVVFNYPQIDGNPYGTLTEDHFDAMKNFWIQTHNGEKAKFGTQNGQVALVLPKDYGWGMRSATDKIWGLWPADDSSSQIWNAMNQAEVTYGLRLDIIFNDTTFRLEGKYAAIHDWNSSQT